MIFDVHVVQVDLHLWKVAYPCFKVCMNVHTPSLDHPLIYLYLQSRILPPLHYSITVIAYTYGCGHHQLCVSSDPPSRWSLNRVRAVQEWSSGDMWGRRVNWGLGQCFSTAEPWSAILSCQGCCTASSIFSQPHAFPWCKQSSIQHHGHTTLFQGGHYPWQLLHLEGDGSPPP